MDTNKSDDNGLVGKSQAWRDMTFLTRQKRHVLDPDGDVLLQLMIKKPYMAKYKQRDEQAKEELDIVKSWMEEPVRTHIKSPEKVERLNRYNLESLAMEGLMDSCPDGTDTMSLMELIAVKSKYKHLGSTKEVEDTENNVVEWMDMFLSHVDDGETLELLVSSEVLSRESPVFERMFSGHFKEALELKAFTSGSSSSCPVIPLDFDEAEAVAKLCYLLHDKQPPEFLDVLHRAETLSLSTSIGLRSLTVLCDKYHCADSTVVQTYVLDKVNPELKLFWDHHRTWLPSSKEFSLIERLVEFMGVAYAFYFSNLFSEAALLTVLFHPGDIDKKSDLWYLLEEHPLLPIEVRGILRRKRAECCEIINDHIRFPLSTRQRWRKMIRECPAIESAIKSYDEHVTAQNYSSYIPDCRRRMDRFGYAPTKNKLPCYYCECTLSSIVADTPKAESSPQFEQLQCGGENCACQRARGDRYKRLYGRGPWSSLFERRYALQKNLSNIKDFACLECVRFNCDSKDCLGTGCECDQHLGLSVRSQLDRDQIDARDKDDGEYWSDYHVSEGE